MHMHTKCVIFLLKHCPFAGDLHHAGANHIDDLFGEYSLFIEGLFTQASALFI